MCVVVFTSVVFHSNRFFAIDECMRNSFQHQKLLPSCTLRQNSKPLFFFKKKIFIQFIRLLKIVILNFLG